MTLLLFPLGIPYVGDPFDDIKRNGKELLDNLVSDTLDGPSIQSQ
jgi:hypothetical protein